MDGTNDKLQHATLDGSAATAVYPSRTLEVRYQKMLSRSIEVCDTNSTTPLYTIKTGAFKPHMIFKSTDDRTIATIAHHNLSAKIDITMRGQTTLLKQEWKWKESHVYKSPTSSAPRTWKSDKLTSMDMVCLDERGIALARWQFAKWSITKLGTIEVVGDAVAGGELLDELVVTGVTVAYFRLKKVGGAGAWSGTAAGAGTAY